MADLNGTSVLDRLTQADPRRAEEPERFRVVRADNGKVLGQTNELNLSKHLAERFARQGTPIQDPFPTIVVRASDGAEMARFDV